MDFTTKHFSSYIYLFAAHSFLWTSLFKIIRHKNWVRLKKKTSVFWKGKNTATEKCLFSTLAVCCRKAMIEGVFWYNKRSLELWCLRQVFHIFVEKDPAISHHNGLERWTNRWNVWEGHHLSDMTYVDSFVCWGWHKFSILIEPLPYQPGQAFCRRRCWVLYE